MYFKKSLKIIITLFDKESFLLLARMSSKLVDNF